MLLQKLTKKEPNTALLKSEETPEVFCPDCDSIMESLIFQQHEEPHTSYLYLNCTGRCHTEWCAKEGVAPEKVYKGTPKLQIKLCTGTENRDLVDLKAKEALAQVSLLDKVVKSFGCTPVNEFAADYSLVMEVFRRAILEHGHESMGIMAVCHLGYMQGIRAERKHRREKAVKINRLLQEGVDNNEI